MSSILKKSGTTSTTHSSGQGSLEDLTSGSSIAPDASHGSIIKSILKNKRHPGSTDDELDHEVEQEVSSSFGSRGALPRSILKSRRSEESLSPLSDDGANMIPPSIINNEDSQIKPILKQRDSSRDEGYHSSKLRDKSRSPTRGITSPPE